MKRKLSKKKVIICIILIMILISFPVFGRYIYNSIRDAYLKSKNFSFSSNLLTATGRSYKYSNWSGVERYEVDLQLYSYENELSLFNYGGNGLEYSISCTVDNPKVTAHIGSVSGNNTSNSYIPNNTNIKDVKIYLIPTETLNIGDTINLTVTAKTTVPYKKEISAEFKIKVTENKLSYKIEDNENSIYAILKLVNSKDTQNRITLTFDPNLIMIDTSDESYTGKISQTTTTISGVEYVNSVTFNMDAEQSKNIKFYKKNPSANYSYPGGESMIISITE